MTISKNKVYPILVSDVSYRGAGTIQARRHYIRIGEGSTNRQLIKDRISAFNKEQSEHYERPFTANLYGEEVTGIEIEKVHWIYMTGVILDRILSI